MPLKGQVTKYTALALRAKANSDINNWDAVLSATNEIINSNKFELYPDFYDYFKSRDAYQTKTCSNYNMVWLVAQQ